MSNQIRKEMEKIEIPKELHERAVLGVKKATKEREHSLDQANRKKRISTPYKKLSIIAAICLLVISALTITPVRAAIHDVYQRIFSSNKIDDQGVREAVKLKKGGIIDQNYYDKDNDITVHFDRILTDDKETKLLLTFRSDKTDLSHASLDLFEGSSSVYVVDGEERKKLKTVGWGSNYYDDKKNEVAEALSFKSIKKLEGKEVTLEIENVTLWDDDGEQGKISTTWPIKFKLDDAAVSEREIKQIEDTSFDFKGITYNVRRIEFSELETRVVVTGRDTKLLTDEDGMQYEIMSELESQFLHARKVSKKYGYIVNEKKEGVFLRSGGERIDPVFSKGEIQGADDEYIMVFAPVKDRDNCTLEVGADLKIPLTSGENRN
ncbi:DUF4179 domain-containing protein [Rossellomorea marisflavi]|uniref:DUF4179 domain-containing protein n=1 Tax=Rossellomorea marisflavi TaxID=189381 RepID=UPI00203E45BE|nr:DUF4179 domain-containing protein [Rossellomorea marisflavi]MCM2591457.1 DUF4179 domain-containing protein [Rossellomorea marisflavi]